MRVNTKLRGDYMKKFLIILIMIGTAVALYFAFTFFPDNRGIQGRYAFVDINYVSPLSSTLWSKESRKNIQYTIGKDYFAIEPGEKTKWVDVSYKKERIDAAFIKAQYGMESLAKEYIRIFFSKSSKGYRYVIIDKNNNEIGYHVFRIGGDIYVCETYKDYHKNGFVKIEEVKKLN
jgi:hypothetical protein